MHELVNTVLYTENSGDCTWVDVIVLTNEKDPDHSVVSGAHGPSRHVMIRIQSREKNRDCVAIRLLW